MKHYTEEEMLNQWKIRNGYVPLRRDCAVERGDGVDLDALLLRQIESAYARLLREAPVDCLPVEDVADECTTTVNDDLSVVIGLPERAVRFVEVRLEGWSRAVTQMTPADSPLAQLQTNRFLHGGPACPVCVEGVRSVTAYTAASADARLARVLAVARPADGGYALDESAWHILLGYAQYDRE
ncbi:MAG: hypothetical protein ACI31D_08775 [Candidatus Limisoma sp.]